MRVQAPAGNEQASLEGLGEEAQEQALHLLRMHVNDSLRWHLEAGQRDFINEIRTCTMVFVGFPSLKVPHTSCVACLHCIMRACNQKIQYLYHPPANVCLFAMAGRQVEEVSSCISSRRGIPAQRESVSFMFGSCTMCHELPANTHALALQRPRDEGAPPVSQGEMVASVQTAVNAVQRRMAHFSGSLLQVGFGSCVRL